MEPEMASTNLTNVNESKSDSVKVRDIESGTPIVTEKASTHSHMQIVASRDSLPVSPFTPRLLHSPITHFEW
jgi:hypothetical protein